MMNTLKLLNRCAVVASLAIMAACGGGGGGGTPVPMGTNNTIVATPSPAGVISVAVGKSQAFNVTFTTSDGKTATNFSITSGLSALPAGWTGPTSLACASVSTGSGCMANLTFTPTTVSTGAVTFNYSYLNNAGTSKTGTATVSYASTGTNNTIVATPSPAGVVSVAVGKSQALSVTFTTSDGKTATNFKITSGLSALPAGWTGPTSLACASVSTGSGCVANLTFKPTAASTGAVTFKYSYVNNAGTSKTGTATVSYASTSNNSVVATPSPAGPIAVITGGHSTVGITFTTSDGAKATGLSITSGLSALPPGWSGPATFTCASVSSGSGCVLNVTYAPTAVANSTLVLGYAYKNNSGTAKTGSISIAYSATTQNHVIATTTPAGQIVAVIGGAGQTVNVNFTTDDTNPATNLAVTPANLTSLPAGWTGPSTFTCTTVSTGNGCQLNLTYAPTQTASGTVTLNFSYINNSGVASTGVVSIGYTASADNTVNVTQSPSGTVNGVVSAPSQPVTVTFNSSDSNPVSNVAITSGLGTLPTGWSGPATFTCASASNTGSGCQLSLAYAPPAVANGSFQLNYSFVAHSGTTKTGSVTILYVATTHNTVNATQSPSGTIGAVVNSGSVPVTLTFTTNDGNPATAVTITSGLSTLSTSFPGWSGPATFSCATVSTGTGCQLALTYAPTVNGSGSVAFGYSYLDDSGTAQTGNASIAYASIPGFLYITGVTQGNVSSCALSGVDGSVSSCTVAATGFSATNAPSGIAFSGNFVYITPGAAATDVDVCPVNSDGSLGCLTPAKVATSFVPPTYSSAAPDALAVSGGYLYVTDADNPYVYNCPINSDGSLGTCNSSNVGTVDTLIGIAVTATNAYMVDINGANLSTCTVSSVDGSLSACTQQTLIGTDPGNTSSTTVPNGVSVYGGNLYVGTGAGTLILPIAGDGTVTVPVAPAVCSASTTTVTSPCTIEESTPAQSAVFGFAFNNGYAYASGYGALGIGICTIGASGILENCATPTILNSFYYGGIAVH